MTNLNSWTFHFSTKIVAGSDVIDAAGIELKTLGVKKVMVITDHKIAETPIIGRVLESFDKSGVAYELFDDVETDPSEESVEKASEYIKKTKCDAVIGVGGGSSIDAAKGAAILTTNMGPINKYEGANKIPNQPLPIFAIPTTAGTGTEVSQTTVLSDGKVKRSIRSVMNTPKIAFLDPTCVASVPKSVAISAGLDALAHNMESYLSQWASPMTDCLSSYGIKLIGRHLRQYVANPENLEAAKGMQLAAMLAAASFVNSRVGLPHALGMALGGVVHIPHGLACGLALAPCMEYSWIGNPQKYRDIANYLGANTDGLNDKEASEMAIREVVDLLHSLDVTIALTEYGVEEEHIEPLAKEMMRAGLQLTDPRKSTIDDCKKILEKALYYDTK